MCGQRILRCKCRIVNWKYVTMVGWEVIILYGRCGGCGQRILRRKCGIVNWKYVTVGFGRL